MKAKPIYAYAPANYSGTAATGGWVNVSKNRKVKVVIQTGAWVTASTAAVTLSQATDSSGTGAKALAFSKMYSAASTTGALTENNVTGNTFYLDAANTLYVIEIDSSDLDADNGFSYLRVNVGSPGTNNDFHCGFYIIEEPRYEENAELNEKA